MLPPLPTLTCVFPETLLLLPMVKVVGRLITVSNEAGSDGPGSNTWANAALANANVLQDRNRQNRGVKQCERIIGSLGG